MTPKRAAGIVWVRGGDHLQRGYGHIKVAIGKGGGACQCGAMVIIGAGLPNGFACLGIDGVEIGNNVAKIGGWNLIWTTFA